MGYSLIISFVLHSVVFTATMIGLPIFNEPELDIPPIIQVELIEISEKTNVPEISKKEEVKVEPKKKEKKEEKKNKSTKS